MSTITIPWAVRTIGEQIADATNDMVGMFPMNVRIPRRIKNNKEYKATFHYDFANVVAQCEPYETEQGTQHQVYKLTLKLVTNETPEEVYEQLNTDHGDWSLIKEEKRDKEYSNLFFQYIYQPF